MTTQIDNKINELFKLIETKKAELISAEDVIKKSWKTTCSILISSIKSTPINIQTANLDVLIDITKYLLLEQELNIKVKNVLNIEIPIGQYQGFSITDWLEDISKRINKLTIKEKQDKLDILEKKLDTLVSPEQRRELELQKIIMELE